MLSEYHRESASSQSASARSDFYRFLYNRSRIKPLNKYFPAKIEYSSTKTSSDTSKCLKDTLHKENKYMSTLNKNIDNNKKYLFSKTKKEEITEEEKILNWLACCDDDSDDHVKSDTKDTCNEESKLGKEETNNYKNETIHKNHSVNNTLDDEKQNVVATTGNEMSNKTSSDLNSINSEESVIPDSQDTSKKKKKSELSLKDAEELNRIESIEILKVVPSESHKQKSSLKKSSQKKISDFFQRIP